MKAEAVFINVLTVFMMISWPVGAYAIVTAGIEYYESHELPKWCPSPETTGAE